MKCPESFCPSTDQFYYKNIFLNISILPVLQLDGNVGAFLTISGRPFHNVGAITGNEYLLHVSHKEPSRNYLHTTKAAVAEHRRRGGPACMCDIEHEGPCK